MANQTEIMGVSASIFRPIITLDTPASPTTSKVTYNPNGPLVCEFPGTIDLSFTAQADGGFWSATLNMIVDQGRIDDWLAHGLGRHVEIYDEGGNIIWEGFVDTISTAKGGLSVTRGPLSGIGNRASVEYSLSQIVGNTIQSVAGLSTDIADNADSKIRFGIWEKVYNGGEVWSDDEAQGIRDMHLDAYGWPQMPEEQFSNQGMGEYSITLNCLGYIHFFKNYIYNANTESTDDVPVAITNTGGTGKMQQVIDADPNGLFDKDNADLFTNAVLEPQWEDSNSDAYTLIQFMVSKGDGSDGRCIFYVGAGRKITYIQIPTTLEYENKLSDASQQVYKTGGSIVLPYHVQPGNWMMFTDFILGDTQPVSWSASEQTMFVESVAYSTPMGLQVSGGKVSTINQALAKLGIGV